MSQAISEGAAALIARSLPIVRRNKEEIVALMALRLADVDPGVAHEAAEALTGLLIRQAGSIVASGGPHGLEADADEHRTLGIGGRHYSRFADALVPILKDVLGAATPHDVPIAWCDAFWAIIESMSAATPLRKLA